MSTADSDDDPFDDEEDERFLEQWAEAERHAAGVVAQALASERGNQPPASIAATAGEVRAAIRAQSYPVSWVARAASLAAAQPDDDAQLLLGCAAATIAASGHRTRRRGGVDAVLARAGRLGGSRDRARP